MSGGEAPPVSSLRVGRRGDSCIFASCRAGRRLQSAASTTEKKGQETKGEKEVAGGRFKKSNFSLIWAEVERKKKQMMTALREHITKISWSIMFKVAYLGRSRAKKKQTMLRDINGYPVDAKKYSNESASSNRRDAIATGS
jgi:adenylyl- and sulfurtransferase ThiI